MKIVFPIATERRLAEVARFIPKFDYYKPSHVVTVKPDNMVSFAFSDFSPPFTATPVIVSYEVPNQSHHALN